MPAERSDCKPALAATPSSRPSDSPLARLAGAQCALADSIDRLLDVACGPFDAIELRRSAEAARHLLDDVAQRLHAVEERHVFTALIESMAGSDPVCLRELAAALNGERRRLEQRWQALRADVERLGTGELASLEGDARRAIVEQFGGGDASAIDNHTLSEFAAAWRAHLSRWHTELLPMAERLLDDAALTAIGCALDAIPDMRLAATSEAPCAATTAQRPAS